MFRDIVLDVWNGRTREAAAVQAALSTRVGELQRREGLLDSAFLYERKIDARTYERQRDDVRQALTLATIELEDARAADVDVEALLRFSEGGLCNAAALWRDAPLEKSLQAALFPEGLRMRDGRFGPS